MVSCAAGWELQELKLEGSSGVRGALSSMDVCLLCEKAKQQRKWYPSVANGPNTSEERYRERTRGRRKDDKRRRSASYLGRCEPSQTHL